MNKTQKKELVKAAIEKFGKQHQLDHFYEEVGELFVAISHHRRGRCAIDEVALEMVDVRMMLDAIEEALGIEHDLRHKMDEQQWKKFYERVHGHPFEETTVESLIQDLEEGIRQFNESPDDFTVRVDSVETTVHNARMKGQTMQSSHKFTEQEIAIILKKHIEETHRSEKPTGIKIDREGDTWLVTYDTSLEQKSVTEEVTDKAKDALAAVTRGVRNILG